MAEYMLLKFKNELDRCNAMLQSELPGHPEVIAVYRAPTTFCPGGSGHKEAWTKGRRWGWWVCDLCGSVSKLAHQNAIRSEAFGFNLLDHTIERQKD